MSFRRSVATGAFAAALAMSGLLPVYAQGGGAGGGGGGGGGGGFGGGPPLYTPEPGAKDMKAVLYSWLWHMGMLRGQAENELIGTLDWHGEGTIQVDGQACTASKLRLQVNYQTPGYRTQIECRRANGQMYSNVEVMSGNYAWDEDRPGAELVAGEGKATAKPAMLEERRIRLWASPQGAPKAALAAAAGVTLADAFVQNPAGLLDRQTAAGVKGTATLTWQGDKPVVTFPIPDVAGATATATLTPDFLAESVVVKHGNNTYEWRYSDYKDFNNPLHPAEALYAGSIVERKNGTVVRDIKSTLTETGQVYVQVAVPASVRSAGGRRN
jgi:hypothetical protein